MIASDTIASGLSLLALAMPQEPSPGIDRELARARKEQISDVQYDLRFRIEPGEVAVQGSMWLRFRLDKDEEPSAPVILDFAGAGLEGFEVNNQPVEPVQENNHLVVPADALGKGWNGIRANFRSKVAPTGTPLTVYRDPVDEREYYYTLLVPADAHGLFPCFDQPDLRAKFRLELDVPDSWTAVANTAPVDASDPEPAGEVQGKLWRFAQTKPLPTYLFAFAAGPFAEITAPPPSVPGITSDAPMRILLRSSKLKDLDRDTTIKMHHDGLAWLANAFDVPYPFDKLDLVLAPGFPYGGMEHAGAIFYRESALVFDHPPTVDEQVRRSTLVYHELSHQWFGNLVTMKWFDDLWLKEGFATFFGYRAMAALEPGQRAWLRFLQRVKPRAYAVDATPGTTPVFQELQNLADAKSAYGAIVYNKAPAVLRALFAQLGPDVFRVGLKNFLEKHAYGNADWRDLAAALEGAARKSLDRWSERWLLAPSMPQVRVSWQKDAEGNVNRAAVTQRAIGSDSLTDSWPMDLELLVFEHDGKHTTLTIRSDSQSTPINQLLGKPAPLAVLANPQDVAYGQFVPDDTSSAWLLDNLESAKDPLVRASAVAALFEAVREAELDPARFAQLVIRLLGSERDADTHRWLLGRLGTCLSRYLPDERSAPLRQQTTKLLLQQLKDEPDSGRELSTFRFLAHNSDEPGVLELCEAVVAGKTLPKGLSPGRRDRFLAATALLVAGKVGDTAEQHPIKRLEASFAGEDIAKELFLARSAIPTTEGKRSYWQSYLRKEDPPEQWTQESLPWFHWPGQEELTLPYLELALKQVEWVKANRRIFFMPAWLNGFINGHNSAAALAIVDKFLAEQELSPDIRQKLLQSRDGLLRAVRIRAAFAR